MSGLVPVRAVELLTHLIHQAQSLLIDKESVEAASQEPESVMLRREVQITSILCGYFHLAAHLTSYQWLPSAESVLHPLIDVLPSSKAS